MVTQMSVKQIAMNCLEHFKPILFIRYKIEEVKDLFRNTYEEYCALDQEVKQSGASKDLKKEIGKSKVDTTNLEGSLLEFHEVDTGYRKF